MQGQGMQKQNTCRIQTILNTLNLVSHYLTETEFVQPNHIDGRRERWHSFLKKRIITRKFIFRSWETIFHPLRTKLRKLRTPPSRKCFPSHQTFFKFGINYINDDCKLSSALSFSCILKFANQLSNSNTGNFRISS